MRSLKPPSQLSGTRPDPGAFGSFDEIDLALTGRANDGITARFTGTAKQAPGVTLEGTLFRMKD